MFAPSGDSFRLICPFWHRFPLKLRRLLYLIHCLLARCMSTPVNPKSTPGSLSPTMMHSPRSRPRGAFLRRNQTSSLLSQRGSLISVHSSLSASPFPVGEPFNSNSPTNLTSHSFLMVDLGILIPLTLFSKRVIIDSCITNWLS